jgi:hypothetical protein
MEEAAFRYGGQLRISSRGQSTRGSTPAWKLVDGLKSPHHKEILLRNVTQRLGLR